MNHEMTIAKSHNMNVVYDYVLIFLLIGVSGIPYLMEKPYIFDIPTLNILTILFIMSSIRFVRRGKFHKYYLFIVLMLIILIIGQTLWFGLFELELAFSLIIRFSIPYFIIVSCKGNFIDYYLKILYYLSIISLIIFLPSQVSDLYNNLITSIANQLNVDSYNHRKSFIIYSIDLNHTRNAGPFWEAGAFCAFLIIGIIFLIHKYKTINTKEFYIYSISLFTTLSTAGFLAYFALITGYIFYHKKIKYRIIFIPLIVILFSYLFTTQEFLQSKISEHYSKQVNTTERMNNLGRFQSAILDFMDISEAPYFGRGRGEHRYSQNEMFVEYGGARRSNGITDFFAKQGVPFGIIFFALVFFSFKKLGEYYSIPFAFILASYTSILIMGFSQLLFTLPLFAGLVYLYLPYKKNENN